MRSGVVFVMVGLAVLATAVVSEALELRGKQIRGVPGRNAQIISKAVELKKEAKIKRIEGGREGLCIDGGAMLCGTVAELTGKILKPGSYTVYPNLPKGVNEYSVTVVLE